MNENPIGIFDSGIGGTSIWKEIHKTLPQENTIYLADSKNAPYGEKPKEEIIRLSIKNTEFLLNQNCKIIVVACNTATTNAIAYLRQNYKVPFIGIEPAIKPAALQTKTGVVGVLATKGTLSSELFHKTANLHASGIKIIEQVGEGLVPLIEAAKIESEEMRELLKKYLKPMIAQQADYLVLGCTHYPYLIPEIKKILPQYVTIIDSGEAVARQTKAVLEQHGLQNTSAKKPKLQFFSNADEKLLGYFLREFKKGSTVKYIDF